MARKRYRITLPDGKATWITGTTIEEAFSNGVKRYCEGFCEKKQKTAPFLKDFIREIYWPSFVIGLKLTTQANYKAFVKNYICRFMGDMRMDEITIDTIQRFHNWMASGKEHGMRSNLNAMTIGRVSGLLSRILKVAESMKIIPESPYKQVLLRNPGKKGGHHKPMMDSEMKRALGNLNLLTNEKELLIAALLLYTGMRREEVCGLMWEDLNLDGGYGRIQRGVTYPNNNHPVVDTTKTSYSERTVVLPEALVDILRKHMKESGYVLGGEKPLCYSTMSRKVKNAFEKLGISRYTPHDLRATFGTQLKENGMSSANVADIMGHADTRMVETVYARRRHEGVMKQADQIKKLFESKRQTEKRIEK